MRVFLPFLLAVAFFSTVPVQAASPVDFDRGTDLLQVIQLAVDNIMPPVAPQPVAAATGDRVWVSMARHDVETMDDALFKRAAVAQNENITIYEFKAAELDQVSDRMQRRFRRAPGFFAHDSLASAMQDLAAPAPVPAKTFTIDQGEKVKSLLKLVNEDAIVSVVAQLSSYVNRNYKSVTGIAASKWVYDHWTALAAGRPDISVTTFKHAAFPQESVILTVRGTVEPEKVVVIGGHIDCLAGGSDSPAPGADDNASGIAVTNEVIRVLVASGYKPAQTLKFIAFAAEEAGLRGSADIAASFKKEGVPVQGMLNLDMANYKGSAQDIYFIADNSSADQNAFLGKLVAGYTEYTWGTTKCGYGCSDHASWTKNGFAASLPFETTFREYNPSIHTANDTLAQTGGRAEHAFKFAKLAVAYAVEMAK